MTQGNIAILLESMLQTWGFFLTDSLDPVEINLHLDKGVVDYIEETITGLRKPGSFETNSQRLNDLQRLKKTSGVISESTPPEVYPEFSLPTDYFHYIAIKAQIAANSETNCPPDDILKKARVVQSDILDELLEDTYHESTIESPICEIENNIVRVYENDFTAKGLVVQYITTPTPFNIEVEGNVEYPLPDNVINRILDKVAIELSKILENPNKAQGLQQNKLL